MLESARIRTYIKDRGPQPVLAGTDCGCGTFAGIGKMDADISYQKLAALFEGAALASRRLWQAKN